MQIDRFLAGWAYPRKACPEYWDALKRYQHMPWWRRLFAGRLRAYLRSFALMAQGCARLYGSKSEPYSLEPWIPADSPWRLVNGKFVPVERANA